MYLSLSVAMVFVLMALACGNGTTTTPTTKPTSTSGNDASYACLDPKGIQPPVQVSSLAARLDTIKGKTIYVNQGEADPIIMPAIWERVQKDFPDTTWKYIFTSSFGPASPEAEVKADGKAVIRGISW
jgi:hypothetical protein